MNEGIKFFYMPLIIEEAVKRTIDDLLNTEDIAVKEFLSSLRKEELERVLYSIVENMEIELPEDIADYIEFILRKE